jgi:hypothetical protein
MAETMAAKGVNALGNTKEPVTTAGTDAELKIGMKVPVEDRVHWVKLPSGGKTESIEWWPGVLYESFTELIQDVGECSMCFYIYICKALALATI